MSFICPLTYMSVDASVRGCQSHRFVDVSGTASLKCLTQNFIMITLCTTPTQNQASTNDTRDFNPLSQWPYTIHGLLATINRFKILK